MHVSSLMAEKPSKFGLWYHENGVLDPLWMAVVNKERRGYYLIGHKGDMLELPFVVA